MGGTENILGFLAFIACVLLGVVWVGLEKILDRLDQMVSGVASINSRLETEHSRLREQIRSLRQELYIVRRIVEEKSGIDESAVRKLDGNFGDWLMQAADAMKRGGTAETE